MTLILRHSDLDDVESGSVRSLGGEAEQVALVLATVDLHRGEAGRVRVHRGLRGLQIHGIDLQHTDDAASSRGDTSEQQPLLVGRRTVVDDLHSAIVGGAIEHLGGLRIAIHAPVEHRSVGHDGDGLSIEPYTQTKGKRNRARREISAGLRGNLKRPRCAFCIHAHFQNCTPPSMTVVFILVFISKL